MTVFHRNETREPLPAHLKGGVARRPSMAPKKMSDPIGIGLARNWRRASCSPG
ncbi:hypothetical protein Rleg_0459 [Rhizobium leguminosarum bv. trifolii WSM1325]|uniref:Uncharacterized protein n=1 Tax=Rhizobium leguminosarum bv. trifolii (strain WSM1325) TaxID=395491 RepID=C6B2E8_RHILS|nr:hypothetical protein Rleg_0459 [Rhizobium leguminosarum bv. trifolii WSM1325]